MYPFVKQRIGHITHIDFFFQAEDGIRDYKVTGVQTCALPISCPRRRRRRRPVAVCRMCLVEVEKMPKLQPACAVYVAEGMVVKTTTEQVGKYQKGEIGRASCRERV